MSRKHNFGGAWQRSIAGIIAALVGAAGFFPGAASVVALVDRFVQHCHVLDLEGESWRQKEPATPNTKSRKPKR